MARLCCLLAVSACSGSSRETARTEPRPESSAPASALRDAGPPPPIDFTIPAEVTVPIGRVGQDLSRHVKVEVLSMERLPNRARARVRIAVGPGEHELDLSMPGPPVDVDGIRVLFL